MWGHANGCLYQHCDDPKEDAASNAAQLLNTEEAMLEENCYLLADKGMYQQKLSTLNSDNYAKYMKNVSPKNIFRP